MKKFALIGKNLSHSFSKDFFNTKFQEEKISCSYENIELKSIEEIKDVFKKEEYLGYNVTIPYKETIIPFLDELDHTAQEIGAVNTIKLLQDKYIGFNTDAFGFQQSIKPFLTNKHEKALIIGTGGASKAVEFVLKNIGISVFFLSRTPQKANHFAYQDVNPFMVSSFKLVINCTPLGTFPNIMDCPLETIHYKNVNSEHLFVDLIYNPEKTKFLEFAENQGASILNGFSMLKEQALKSWEIWNNKV